MQGAEAPPVQVSPCTYSCESVRHPTTSGPRLTKLVPSCRFSCLLLLLHIASSLCLFERDVGCAALSFMRAQYAAASVWTLCMSGWKCWRMASPQLRRFFECTSVATLLADSSRYEWPLCRVFSARDAHPGRGLAVLQEYGPSCCLACSVPAGFFAMLHVAGVCLPPPRTRPCSHPSGVTHPSCT